MQEVIQEVISDLEEVSDEELEAAGDFLDKLYICEGYAHGVHGFEKNPEELERLAELGWSDARCYVLNGYEKGLFGFEKDESKSKELQKKWNISLVLGA